MLHVPTKVRRHGWEFCWALARTSDAVRNLGPVLYQTSTQAEHEEGDQEEGRRQAPRPQVLVPSMPSSPRPMCSPMFPSMPRQGRMSPMDP